MTARQRGMWFPPSNAPPKAYGTAATVEESKSRYLIALRKLGVIRDALEAEHLTVEALYRWRSTDEEFSRDEQLIRDDLYVQATPTAKGIHANSAHLPLEAAIEYIEGASVKQLAKKYDLDQSTISKKLRRAGIKMRPRGRPPRKK